MENQKGKYVEIEKTIHHDAIQPVEEVSHLEVIKEYPNGGRDVKKVIDVPAVEGKPAWDEILFRIQELKALLKESDYKAIKYAEGLFTEVEYAPIKALRQSYRAEINALEAKYL